MSGGAFPGFPERITYLPVPTAFFGALLRDVDDLAELKLSLHCWRLIQQQKGGLRYLTASGLRADRALLQALRNSDPAGPERALDRALAAACRRGTLLGLEVVSALGREVALFLNTPQNRRAVQAIQSGQLSLGPLRPAAPVPAPLPRPGIYELYEQNVGLLTPLLAEELRDAEQKYPPEWIEDAFREAVSYNRRSWRYVRRILENWATHGRGEGGENRGYPQPPEDPGEYFQGPYGRLLRR
jgi:DnaD/phage-associated family protein